MRINKKPLLAFLSLASVLTVFAGCKKKSTKKNTTKANTTNVVTTSNKTTNKTTEKQTTKKTTVDKDLKYKVDEETFNKFFNITLDTLDDLNYSISYEQNYSGIEYTGALIFDGTRLMDDYTNLKESDSSTVYHEITSISDQVYCNKYYYDYRWIDNGEVYESINGFVSNCLWLLTIDFDKVTFNPQTKCYEANNISVEGQGVYNDIKIKYEDGALYSYEYTLVYPDNDCNQFSATILNIGETYVNDPFEKYRVSEEVFNKYFNVTADTLDDLNLTIDYSSRTSSDYYTGTILFDGTNQYDYEEKFDSEEYLSQYRFITSTVDGITFDYYQKNNETNTWSNKLEFTRSIDWFMAMGLSMPTLKYSDMKFNCTYDYYEIDEVEIDGVGIFSEIRVFFENGKLVTFDYMFYEDNNEDNGFYFNAEVSSIGETTVENPINKD